MQVQQAMPLHSDTVVKHLCQHPHEPENEREQAYQIGRQVVGSHRRVGLPWPHQVWPSNALLHVTPSFHSPLAQPIHDAVLAGKLTKLETGNRLISLHSLADM